ncbi:hypothetical protein AAEX28_01200 [Lentisphaerota bacterium WC36G]
MGYIATIIGAIFEFRAWSKFFPFFTNTFVKLGRFSPISGISFLTSFISSKAANTLISSSYSEKSLSRHEMFLCACCNSYAAYFSHALRIAPAFIGITGLVGVYYYLSILGPGLLFTIVFILINFLLTKRQELKNFSNSSKLTQTEDKLKNKVLSWQDTLKRANKRGLNLIKRILIVSTPLYFYSSYLASAGVFKQWTNSMPEMFQSIVSPEILTILVSRLGGLTAAGNVGAGLLANGNITALGFLQALIIGNIITNPIRTFRRNLPTALSIFPQLNGLYLVLLLQFLRLIASIIILYFIINLNK